MISPCCTYETFRVENNVIEYDVCKKCGLPWAVTVEEWIPVENYPTYEVSTTGQVRKSKMKIDRKDKKKKCYGARNPKQTDTITYKRVNLNVNGVKHSPQVHNIIGENWVLNPHGYKNLEHVSGNIYDNSYLNLKWVKNGKEKKHSKRLY